MSKLGDDAILPVDLIRQFPKADLHCHLDGSVRVSTIVDLARQQNVELPTKNLEELQGLVSVDDSCESLVDYLRGFEITLSVMQKAYAITRCVYEVCEDASRDGVRYLEIRFSPILHTKEGLSLSQIMEAACDGLSLAEYHLSIRCRLIVCGMRQLPGAVTQSLAEIAWRYAQKGVVGFDLAGPEAGFSSEQHKEAFSIIHSRCVNCTLHSGEADGWESIHDSIFCCGAQRIGHGTRLRENAELLKFVVDRRIPLEVCITSNLQTKAVTSLDDHPIRQYYEAGVVVVPCTDNKTVSNVTLSSEYARIQSACGLSISDLVAMIDYGFTSAFIDKTERTTLRYEAFAQIVYALSEHGYDVSQVLQRHWQLAAGLDLHADEGGPVRECRLNVVHVDPPITLDLLKKLPKADLHCRFETSVPAAALSELATEQRAALFSTTEEAHELFCAGKGHGAARARARDASVSLLQNAEAITTGFNALVSAAAEDGVRYMELFVSPLRHCRAGMTPRAVLEAFLAAREQRAREGCRVDVGFVITVNAATDDPVSFFEIAQLTCDLVHGDGRGSVVGFGVTGRIEVGEFRLYRRTFEYLKRNYVNVCVAAGFSEPQTVLEALQQWSAGRISGAFSIHQDPALMAYLANRDVPIELSLSSTFDACTEHMRSFAHPVRLLLDNDIRVLMCSIECNFSSHSRSEMLLRVAEECNFSTALLLKLLSHGFRRSFQSHEHRQKLFRSFWSESTSILRASGFQHFKRKRYYMRPVLGQDMKIGAAQRAHAKAYATLGDLVRADGTAVALHRCASLLARGRAAEAAEAASGETNAVLAHTARTLSACAQQDRNAIEVAALDALEALVLLEGELERGSSRGTPAAAVARAAAAASAAAAARVGERGDEGARHARTLILTGFLSTSEPLHCIVGLLEASSACGKERSSVACARAFGEAALSLANAAARSVKDWGALGAFAAPGSAVEAKDTAKNSEVDAEKVTSFAVAEACAGLLLYDVLRSSAEALNDRSLNRRAYQLRGDYYKFVQSASSVLCAIAVRENDKFTEASMLQLQGDLKFLENDQFAYGAALGLYHQALLSATTAGNADLIAASANCGRSAAESVIHAYKLLEEPGEVAKYEAALAELERDAGQAGAPGSSTLASHAAIQARVQSFGRVLLDSFLLRSFADLVASGSPSAPPESSGSGNAGSISAPERASRAGRLLRWASAIGDEGLVMDLLQDWHVDPSAAQDADQVTPLHAAASHGHVGVVRILLSHGAGVDAETSTFLTPLEVAVAHGQADVAQLLRGPEGCASPFLRDEVFDLRRRRRLEDKPRARATVHRRAWDNVISPSGEDVPSEDAHHRPALHLACLRGSTGFVEWALARGFDPRRRDDHRWTALHWLAWARREGNNAASMDARCVAIGTLLLDAAPELATERDEDGMLPVDILALRRGRPGRKASGGVALTTSAEEEDSGDRPEFEKLLLAHNGAPTGWWSYWLPRYAAFVLFTALYGAFLPALVIAALAAGARISTALAAIPSLLGADVEQSGEKRRDTELRELAPSVAQQGSEDGGGGNREATVHGESDGDEVALAGAEAQDVRHGALGLRRGPLWLAFAILCTIAALSWPFVVSYGAMPERVETSTCTASTVDDARLAGAALTGVFYAAVGAFMAAALWRTVGDSALWHVKHPRHSIRLAEAVPCGPAGRMQDMELGGLAGETGEPDPSGSSAFDVLSVLDWTPADLDGIDTGGVSLTRQNRAITEDGGASASSAGNDTPCGEGELARDRARGNAIDLVLMVVDFMALASYSFLPENVSAGDLLPDGLRELREAFSVAVLRFGSSSFRATFVAGAVLLFVWVALTAYLGAAMLVLRVRKFREWFPFVREDFYAKSRFITRFVPALSVTLFLTLATVFFKALDCTYDGCDGAGVVAVMDWAPEIRCWSTSEHRGYATIAFLFSVLYLPTAMTFGIYFLESREDDSDIRFVPRFIVLDRVMKWIQASVGIFFTQYSGFVLGTAISVNAVLGIATMKWKPCEHIDHVNIFRALTHAAIGWSAFSSLLALWIDEAGSWAPFYVFIVGVVALLGAAIVRLVRRWRLRSH